MYCPECGAEYRDGIVECVDCEVPLTSSPPAEPSHEGESTVAIHRTSDAALLPVLKSVLAAAEIPYSIQGDEASGLFPFGSTALVPDGRRFGAVIRVPESRADEARELIDSASIEGGEEEE